jgi:hypothetical protein
MVQKVGRVEQPDGNLDGMRIGIKRVGAKVQIQLQCSCDYQAIELYDYLVEGARKGEVTIDMRRR